jgi:hypothetical protein
MHDKYFHKAVVKHDTCCYCYSDDSLHSTATRLLIFVITLLFIPTLTEYCHPVPAIPHFMSLSCSYQSTFALNETLFMCMLQHRKLQQHFLLQTQSSAIIILYHHYYYYYYCYYYCNCCAAVTALVDRLHCNLKLLLLKLLFLKLQLFKISAAMPTESPCAHCLT